eukprot:gene15477-21563_t
MAPLPPPRLEHGPPALVVKKVLSLFGSKREEDKMVGYLSFLKIGPKLLKFIPGNKAADLKHWLTTYGYWNQGGLSNVVSMFTYIVQAYLPASAVSGRSAPKPAALIETPPLGCVHPLYRKGREYFTSPAEYMKWYQREGTLKGSGAPVVAMLLYRKHVITEQPYIEQLINQMESVSRNIHALDPYRMPSPAAEERGSAAAKAIIEAHREANNATAELQMLSGKKLSYYKPRDLVAVNLWGLDAIKTKGESVAIALYLVGARPVKEGTGRVARFELIPLEELGRPRIDVLCNMSGIFRDSFQNVVELLDDLFQRAAAADEPPAINLIRAHSKGMEAEGHTNTAARLFSNPAGDYGSMVNDYGRGGERGTARPEVLQGLLKTCDRVVQEIDSVEYGLTDIQEYYANTGALKQAAQSAKGAGGKKVGCSIVETFGKDVKPKELEDVLRLEWAEAMANQGSGGAYEISQRMTAAVGWGATANFQEDWVWDQAAETYALDPEMAEKLRKANPEAFGNVLRRMLEASGRGMWSAKPEVLDQLREMYAEMDDELEGVTGPNARRKRGASCPCSSALMLACPTLLASLHYERGLVNLGLPNDIDMAQALSNGMTQGLSRRARLSDELAKGSGGSTKIESLCLYANNNLRYSSITNQSKAAPSTNRPVESEFESVVCYGVTQAASKAVILRHVKRLNMALEVAEDSVALFWCWVPSWDNQASSLQGASKEDPQLGVLSNRPATDP